MYISQQKPTQDLSNYVTVTWAEQTVC